MRIPLQNLLNSEEQVKAALPPDIVGYIDHQTDINQIIKLEASRREDDKNGRSYKIHIFATDLAGNTTLVTQEVLVPHDQRNQK